ncbi:aminodeoxychorismate synthase component I [Gordonia sp. DT30]|uniref:aminodeoxychorismate synthase component I n=1 Tax=Gordonia sp. DT30 TaxID=3416546 RepID=UPI003CEE82D0
MTATALDVLRALYAHTRRHGLPPPAALIGDWWGADAVIAPSIEIRAGLTPDAGADRFWLGYCGFGGPRATAAMLPPGAGGVTAHLLVLREGRWDTVSVDGSAPPGWVVDAVAGASATLPTGAAWATTWVAPDHDHHLAAIEKCLDAIRAGEIYQACVCTRFTGRLDGDPIDFYHDVAATTRPAKSAFLQGDWGAMTSFSPESFLRRTGNIVTSSPIKGTIPADADPGLLSASTKDIAENVMIVDLVRNDLGRVAVTGSVRVTDLLEVVAAPGVWHLVSTVQAIVGPDLLNTRLLDATWPPASVTGTPKIRAAALLEEWEAHPRGAYCGAVGLAGPDGLLDLSVAIRTVEISPAGRLELGVGGGITIDSIPEREWQECLDKAASIVGARALTRDR